MFVIKETHFYKAFGASKALHKTDHYQMKEEGGGGGGEDAIEGVRLKHLWLVLGIQLWTCDVENEAKLGCYLAGTGKIGNWRTDKPKQLVNQTQRFFF